MVCGLEEKDKGLAVGLFHDVLRQVLFLYGAVGGGRYHERDGPSFLSFLLLSASHCN